MDNHCRQETQESIFYVTPDFSRAIGLEKFLPNYHIVCSDNHPLIDCLISQGVKIFSLERETGEQNTVFRNTGKILEHPLVAKYINEHSQGQPHLLYFKPSKKIDFLCQERGYRQLGNREEINLVFEDKVSFFDICQNLGVPVPPGEIGILGEYVYRGLASRYGNRLVVQFGRGWAGNTTYFVADENGFMALQKRFPKKKVRITQFIHGKTVLNNACVTERQILISPLAQQITSPPGFTSNPGGTCGRQWPAEGVSEETKRELGKYTLVIGEEMRRRGYKGFFGLDFLLEEQTNKVYVSEDNARLTASTPLYTKMELMAKKTPLLLFHLCEFMGKRCLGEIIKEGVAGGELIIRNDQGRSVMVQKSFPSGVYSYEGGRLTWLRNGCSFEDLSQENEFLITAAESGRKISPENEIAKLTFRKSIVDSEGMVAAWARGALLEVKSSLQLSLYD